VDAAAIARHDDGDGSAVLAIEQTQCGLRVAPHDRPDVAVSGQSRERCPIAQPAGPHRSERGDRQRPRRAGSPGASATLSARHRSAREHARHEPTPHDRREDLGRPRRQPGARCAGGSRGRSPPRA
jgi:hypothetical protein